MKIGILRKSGIAVSTGLLALTLGVSGPVSLYADEKEKKEELPKEQLVAAPKKDKDSKKKEKKEKEAKLPYGVPYRISEEQLLFVRSGEKVPEKAEELGEFPGVKMDKERVLTIKPEEKTDAEIRKALEKLGVAVPKDWTCVKPKEEEQKEESVPAEPEKEEAPAEEDTEEAAAKEAEEKKAAEEAAAKEAEEKKAAEEAAAKEAEEKAAKEAAEKKTAEEAAGKKTEKKAAEAKAEPASAGAGEKEPSEEAATKEKLPEEAKEQTETEALSEEENAVSEAEEAADEAAVFSGILEAIVLTASEISASDGDYRAYWEQAEAAVREEEGGEVRLSAAYFLDICFVYEGAEVEPAVPVSVKISCEAEPLAIEEDGTLRTVHFAENVPEILPAETVAAEDGVSEVAFEAEGFSVYGLCGTESVRTAAVGDMILRVPSRFAGLFSQEETDLLPVGSPASVISLATSICERCLFFLISASFS